MNLENSSYLESHKDWKTAPKFLKDIIRFFSYFAKITIFFLLWTTVRPVWGSYTQLFQGSLIQHWYLSHGLLTRNIHWGINFVFDILLLLKSLMISFLSRKYALQYNNSFSQTKHVCFPLCSHLCLLHCCFRIAFEAVWFK